MPVTRWIRISWLSFILLAGCATSTMEPIAEDSPEQTTLPPPLVSEATALPSATPSTPGKPTMRPAIDPGLTPSGEDALTAMDTPQTAGVSVSADRLHYNPGETILITVRREAGTVIFPTPGEMGCSVITVERLQDGSWEPAASCPLSGPDSAQPGAQMRDLAWGFSLDTLGPEVKGPGAGQPSVPDMFEGDLSDLPTLTPPPPGYSGPEVPRGPGRPELGDSSLTALEPGTYRIVFSFSAGFGTVITMVYSDPFIVED